MNSEIEDRLKQENIMKQIKSKRIEWYRHIDRRHQQKAGQREDREREGWTRWRKTLKL